MGQKPSQGLPLPKIPEVAERFLGGNEAERWILDVEGLLFLPLGSTWRQGFFFSPRLAAKTVLRSEPPAGWVCALHCLNPQSLQGSTQAATLARWSSLLELTAGRKVEGPACLTRRGIKCFNTMDCFFAVWNVSMFQLWRRQTVARQWYWGIQQKSSL